MPRPYVLVSVAVSADGCLDDRSPQRLLLSDAADFDRVDEIRADCDAILVGAQTIRLDNPRLLVRDPARIQRRTKAGRTAQPVAVAVTRSGELDPDAVFWRLDRPRLAYTTDAGAALLQAQVADPAAVVTLGPGLDLGALLDDLGGRGVHKLMVEGGARIHTAFLTAGLVDELQLAIAPVFVGDPRAPRLLGPAEPAKRMRLAEVSQVGDMAVLRYLAR